MRENHIRWGSMVLPGTGTFLCCKKKKLPFGFGSHRTRKRLSYIPSPSCWISVISWKAIPSVCYGRCTILQIKAFSSPIGAHPAFLCPPCGGGMDGCYLGFDLPGNLSYRLLNNQGLVTEQTHSLLCRMAFCAFLLLCLTGTH